MLLTQNPLPLLPSGLLSAIEASRTFAQQPAFFDYTQNAAPSTHAGSLSAIEANRIHFDD
jgi:hypothetical protein